jgi:hypothetical protein
MVIAIVRLRSSELLEQDRILIAFFLPALAVVTAFAIAVKAYDNWAAVSFVSGAVLTAAVLSRKNARGWMWLCIAIGIVAQMSLIAGDAVANRLWLPSVGNPYHRTLGWREFAQAAGQMARQAQANTIASGSRSEFAVLRYYWRDRPEPVLWWRSAALPDFESKQALTAASREPILFVSGCPAVDQVVGSVYAEIKPLGPFAVPIARSPQSGQRVFYGYRLSGARGPIPPLGGC